MPLDEPKEPFYDQVYQLVPGAHLRRRPHRRRRQRHGRGDRAGPRAPSTSTPSRSIRPSSASGVEEHPDHPTTTRGSRASSTTAGPTCARTDKQYDLVVFALPDSLTLVSTAANIRLESFLFTEEAFASVRDHLKPGGVFVLYNYYREPWLVAKLAADARRTPSARRRSCAPTRNVQAALAAGPGVAARRWRCRRATASARSPIPASRSRKPATDDWPFLYLRTGFVAPYYLVALAIILAFAAARGARCGAGDGHADPALQPALLRPRHGLPAARDAQPGQLQPALRHDLDRQRPGLLRHPGQRPGGHPDQRALPHPAPERLLRRALRGARRRLPAAAGAAAHRPALAALRARRRAGLHARSSSPTSSSATPSATRPRPTWPSPATSSGRWSAARSSTSPC